MRLAKFLYLGPRRSQSCAVRVTSCQIHWSLGSGRSPYTSSLTESVHTVIFGVRFRTLLVMSPMILPFFTSSGGHQLDRT